MHGNKLPLIITLFFILRFVKSDKCFIYKEKNHSDSCLMCKPGYFYDIAEELSVFKEEDCLENKYPLNESRLERIIYIAPRFTLLNQEILILNEKNITYKNLVEALREEHKIFLATTVEEKSLKVKLLKGDHYVFDEDFKGRMIPFFYNNALKIEISPLKCEESPSSLSKFCYENLSEASVIYVKTILFRFSISMQVHLINLVIDGVDLPLYFIKINNCKNETRICCDQDSCSLTDENQIISTSDKEFFLFSLEPSFENYNKAPASIILEFTEIRNLILKASGPSSLVILHEVQVNIIIKFSNFNFLSLSSGLLNKKLNLPYLFSLLLETGLISATPLTNSSLITFQDSSISYYTGLNLRDYELLTDKSIIFLLEFEGRFIFKNNNITNVDLPKDQILFFKNEKPRNECLIIFESNSLCNMTLNFIASFEDHFTRTSMVISFIGNVYKINDLSHFLILTHVKKFILSEAISEPFKLPVSGFILAAYSNFYLNNCSFSGLTANAQYFLIQLVSLYRFSTEKIFNNAKREAGIFLSNETTEINNCQFSNNSFLLFSNPILNFKLVIRASIFEGFNLLIHETSPFIDLVSEGPLLFEHLVFKTFFSKSNLIAARPFLNGSINNITLENINIISRDVIYFFSVTLSDKNEHQLNITSFRAKDILLEVTAQSLGKLFICVLYSFSPESGKGPAVIISNIFLNNIYHSRTHIKHHAIRLDSCILKADNIFGFNISNSIFFAHNPRTSTADLFVNNMQFNNPENIPLYRLFECGVSYFTNALFINSKFAARNLLFNSAAGFNLAQNLIIKNCSFDLYQKQGTLLFAQVNRMSTIFVIDLRVKSYPGSNAALFTLASEIQDKSVPWGNISLVEEQLLKNFYNAFGIHNSSFEMGSGGAIILLFQSQALFKNVTFLDTEGPEGGAVRLSTASTALLYKCYFLRSYSESFGGTLSIESGSLLLFAINVNGSSSKVRGGIINAVDSQVFISNSTFNDSSSNSGGAIFSDSSVIKIRYSNFGKSLARIYGGHISGKQGTIFMYGVTFDKGEALNYGGSLYLESTYFELSRAVFNKCKSRFGTIYSFGGNAEKAPLIEITIFSENYASGTGAALFLSDVQIILKTILFSANKGDSGDLCKFMGMFFQPKILMENVSIMNNIVHENLFSLTDVNFNAIHLSSNENTVHSGVHLKILNSFFNLTCASFTLKNTTLESISDSSFFFMGRNSKFFLNTGLYVLGETRGMSCVDCQIFSKSTYLKNGKGLLGGAMNLIKGSLQSILMFVYNCSATRGGAVYARGVNISLLSCFFYMNEADDYGSDIFTANEEGDKMISLYSCIFMNIKGTSIWADLQDLMIQKSVFLGAKSSRAQAIFIFRTKVLTVNGSFFANFYEASAIELLKRAGKIMKISINSSSFKSSYNSFDNGGFLKNSDVAELTINNSNFSSGFAIKGGAVYFFCSIHNCPIFIYNSIFMENIASDSGGCLNSESINLSEANNKFYDNKAPIGDNLNFYPTEIKLIVEEEGNYLTRENVFDIIRNIPVNGSPLIRLRLAPGEKVTLIIAIVDKLYNIQTNQNGISVYLDVFDSENKFKSTTNTFTNNQAKLDKGLAKFESLMLIGKASVNVSGKISFKYGKTSLIYFFPIEVGKCKRGYSYQDQRCIRCPENFYSLNLDPVESLSNCQVCPDNGYCPGGDGLIPMKDYWRMNENSSLLILCKYKDACPKQSERNSELVSSFRYICSYGYEDNLCESCAPGFGLVKNQCISCESTKAFFIVMLIFGFLTYIFYVQFKEKKCSVFTTDNEIALIKIFVNHLSIFIMLSAVKINWSSMFRDFLTIPSAYLSTSPSSIFSYDCLMELDKFNKVKLTMILAGVSPILLNFLMFIVNFIFAIISFSNKKVLKIIPNPQGYLKLHSHPKWLGSEFTKHLVIIFFNIYPQVLIQSFNIFGCKQLDDSKELLYSVNYPWIQCGSLIHRELWLIGAFYTIFWGGIIPCIFFIYIFKYFKSTIVKKEKEASVKINFVSENNMLQGFLDFKLYYSHRINMNRFILINFATRSYKKKYFWWETCIYFRKIFLLLIASYSEDIDTLAIGGLTIFVMTFFLILTLFYSPYESNKLNFLEYLSLIISIITIAMGLITSNGSGANNLIKSMASIILFMVNIIFFVIWFLYFLVKVTNKFVIPLISRFESRKRTFIIQNK